MAKFLAKGSTVVFNSLTIGSVASITLPDASKEEVDVTTHDSTGVYREFLAGLADPGTVTLECMYDPDDAGQQELVDNFNAAGNTVEQCRITLPAAAAVSTITVTFDAFVQAMPGDLPGTTAAPATRTFTLRVTGPSTEAGGA